MPKKLPIGGQAVIEGVMIRSPKHNVVSVRKKKNIITKHDKVKVRKGWQTWPILRGFFNLIDMMVLGMKSLMWSADQQTEDDEKITSMEFALTIAFSLLITIVFFIGIPYFATIFIGIKEETRPLLFNFVDGLIRIAIFLGYIMVISRMKDIQILFRYHGAEHKSIHCYEHDKDLNVKNVQSFSTIHPRCGTAFIMIVLVVSILVYSILTPIIFWALPWLLSIHIVPQKILLFFIRILFFPLIAGVAYEFLKFSAKFENNGLMKIFIWPGLLMQKITTSEPTNKQVEVAIAAVKKSLQLEKVKTK